MAAQSSLILPVQADTQLTATQPGSEPTHPANIRPVRPPLRLIWLTGAIGLVLLAWWYTQPQSTQVSYHSATVEQGDIQALVTATGSVSPVEWIDVGAQVSGQLRSLQVSVGDNVQQGVLLARIDAAVQHNLVRASRAGLEAEKARLSAGESAANIARAQMERQTQLSEQALTSQLELERATNQLAAAESALAELQSRISRSEAGLASDEAQLNYSSIFAPMSGTVIAVDKKVGQTLNATQQVPTILRIADLSAMTVRAEVSEADIGQLQPGTPCYFTTLGGGERRWHSEIEQILPTPTVRNGVVFYPVLFEVANTDGALLPEMTTQVFFITAEATDAIKVPANALIFQDGSQDRAQVDVLTSTGPIRRTLSLGITDRAHVQVLEGLSAGDQVILRDGLR